MKVVKKTGLVPVRLKSAFRAISPGEIRGFLPMDAKSLVKSGVGELVDIPDDIESEDSDLRLDEEVEADRAAKSDAGAGDGDPEGTGEGDHGGDGDPGAFSGDNVIHLPEDWQALPFFSRKKIAKSIAPDADLSTSALVNAVIEAALAASKET